MAQRRTQHAFDRPRLHHLLPGTLADQRTPPRFWSFRLLEQPAFRCPDAGRPDRQPTHSGMHQGSNAGYIKGCRSAKRAPIAKQPVAIARPSSRFVEMMARA